MASKRNFLTSEQKINVIKLSEQGSSIRHIATELKCGRTQINNVLKRKAEILEQYEGLSNSASPFTKKRKTGFEEINRLCWIFFQDCSKRHINLSGPLLKEKALKFATLYHRGTFH